MPFGNPFALPPFFIELFGSSLLRVIYILSDPAILLENLSDDPIRMNLDHDILMSCGLSKKRIRVFLVVFAELLHGCPITRVEVNF